MTALDRFVAQQLHSPSTVVGRLVLGRLWNRRNRALNGAAFEALALRPGDRVLEVGFGGGYLLGRMVAAVADGFVAGVGVAGHVVSEEAGFCAGAELGYTRSQDKVRHRQVRPLQHGQRVRVHRRAGVSVR